MHKKTGETAPNITLPDIKGGEFDLKSFKGKRILLSFYRFASCPFCNLRLRSLVALHSELATEIEMVAIFDSSLDNLKRHTEKHQAPFPILADETNAYYKEYGIEHSVTGMLKGMFMRMPTLLGAMLFHGYFPFPIKGSLITMPADFLIDERGIIRTAYYGKDEGDHLPFEEIKDFATVAGHDG